MKFFKKLNAVLILILLVVAYNGCDSTVMEDYGIQLTYTGKPAKYVFMFIGDGMAMPQIFAASDYLGAKADPDADEPVKLNMLKLPVSGNCTTYASNTIVTDSAAAGTALATGEKTNSGVISMNEDGTVSYPTIAELAKAEGMKVGIISSVSIDHATPAVYYSHVPSRKKYTDIDNALLNSDFDYFAGGGFLGMTQENAETTAVAKGFAFADTRSEFEALSSGRAIAVNPYLDSSKAMPYAVNRLNNSAYEGSITLAEFTQKGIELLDNDNGFFMMIEGGKIDWACHANDAAASIQDTLAFDDAIKVAMEFYLEHATETLIIVTADHETGGMTNGFANTGYATYMELIDAQTIAYDDFGGVIRPYLQTEEGNPNYYASLDDVLPLIETSFGLTTEFGSSLSLSEYDLDRLREALLYSIDAHIAALWDSDYNDYTNYTTYGGYDPLTVTCTHIMNEKAGIGWTSYSHTGVPVPVFAMGAGMELFEGYYDNTDIFSAIKKAMDID